MRALRTLLDDQKAGDHYTFFCMSPICLVYILLNTSIVAGHGTQRPSTDKREKDGKDECQYNRLPSFTPLADSRLVIVTSDGKLIVDDVSPSRLLSLTSTN
jgi:hypothetical protein